MVLLILYIVLGCDIGLTVKEADAPPNIYIYIYIFFFFASPMIPSGPI